MKISITLERKTVVRILADLYNNDFMSAGDEAELQRAMEQALANSIPEALKPSTSDNTGEAN